MSNEKKTDRAALPRRPYERPAVVTDEVFETMALSCAKSNRFTCPGGNPQSS
jgi:hypothetical protein